MENEFIKILGKAEWEDEVIEIIEKYNFLEDENFEEGDGGYTRWTPRCAFAHLSFNKKCETPEQKRRKAEGNYYLNRITFAFTGVDWDDNVIENTDGLDVPFGLKRGDTYKDVIEKLGEPHLEDDDYEIEDQRLRKMWNLTKETGELYHVVIGFDNQSEKFDLEEMVIWTLDPEDKLTGLVPHSYDPLKKK